MEKFALVCRKGKRTVVAAVAIDTYSTRARRANDLQIIVRNLALAAHHKLIGPGSPTNANV